MKKSLTLLLLIAISVLAMAQEKQAVVILKNGTELKGIIKSFNPIDAITMVIAGIETTISMDDVAKVESVDNTTPTTQEEPIQQPSSVKPKRSTVDKLKDFKGFLLARGNNVYVYSSNSDNGFDKSSKYDSAAATVLKKALKEDGFWNVVDNMIDAHFTINYLVDTRRSDITIFSISSFRTDKVYSFVVKSGNEDVADNKKLAATLYKKYIVPFQKKILKGKLSKSVIADFTMGE